MSTTPSAYDTVEYPGFAYADTHPDQLAVMALLYGLEPAPVPTCRVLEVACNAGANLIPMAYAIPNGEFTGFDLAPECVARGQQRIRELGLKNIRIFQADLMQIGAELGEFDYIIAHGLYAWVPEPVRDRLLALCGEHLADNGIAFISYNALPGSYHHQQLREMMMTTTAGIHDPEKKLEAGKELVRALAAARPEGDLYRALFEDHLRRLDRKSARAVFHDDFSPEYHPVYFSQFIEHAGKHGLQYLSEAVLPPPGDPCFNPEFQKVIQSTSSDPLVHEQMLDYARMRSYRETLLCRAHHQLRPRLPPSSVERLCFASAAVSEPRDDDSSALYTVDGATTLRCTQPAVIAVMQRLIAAWPHALPYAEIAPALAEHGVTEPDKVAILLLQLAISHMIELHAWSPPLAKGISDRPRAAATSRLDARTGDSTPTLWHTQGELTDPICRRCLELLDGTRNHADLVEALNLEFPDTPVEELEKNVKLNLEFLYRIAVLED